MSLLIGCTKSVGHNGRWDFSFFPSLDRVASVCFQFLKDLRI